MTLTYSSFLTSIIISVPFLFFQSILLRFLNKSRFISPQFLNIVAILFIIRMLFPVEFFYTITIPSSTFFPSIRDFLLSIIPFTDMTISNLLIIIWTTGSVYQLSKLIHSYYLLIQLFNTTSKEVDSSFSIPAEFNRENIRLIKGLTSPCVTGLFNPTIFLPDTLFNEKELSYILKHEYLHVSRMDIIINFIYEILVAIYWWNPIMYVFRKQLTHIIELNVDNELTHSFSNSEKLEYIELLLKVQTQQPLISESSSFFSHFSIPKGETLLHRSHNILVNKKMNNSSLLLIVLLSLGFYLTTSIIIEPYYEDSELLTNTIGFSEDNSFLLPNSTGGYDLYINGMLIGDIGNADHEAFESIPVYQATKEVIK